MQVGDKGHGSGPSEWATVVVIRLVQGYDNGAWR